MRYLVTYLDGSTEYVTADSISEGKEAAAELYPDAPVKRIVVVDDNDDDDLEDDEDEEDGNPGEDDEDEESD